MRVVTSLTLLMFLGAPVLAADLSGLAAGERAELEELYKHFHANPELSYFEEKTSALIAESLRKIGYTVTERVGDYGVEGRVSYGVVGVLENGQGPTVLVRTDTDALPVQEETGLPYASKVRLRTEAGVETGVMHACGHDVHMTCFLGTARLLYRLRDEWQGTVVLIAQPAEERGAGAKAMLDAGLYRDFPKPDYALALHASPFLEAGVVGLCPEYALANVDSVDITVRGKGGHGAYPHATKDPVVLAAQIVLGLQTIASRIISPLEPVVVTVGSIHGGTKHNIIPDDVHLQLTVRSYKPEVRKQVLASIRTITENTALASGTPPELLPIVTVEEKEFTPSTYNNPALVERLRKIFAEELGEDGVVSVNPVMAGEDFSRFSLENLEIPSVIFWLGTVDAEKLAAAESSGEQLPPLHSSSFAPSPHPTLENGVRAMTAAALKLLQGEE